VSCICSVLYGPLQPIGCGLSLSGLQRLFLASHQCVRTVYTWVPDKQGLAVKMQWAACACLLRLGTLVIYMAMLRHSLCKGAASGPPVHALCAWLIRRTLQ